MVVKTVGVGAVLAPCPPPLNQQVWQSTGLELRIPTIYYLLEVAQKIAGDPPNELYFSLKIESFTPIDSS
jgi:hypothetical protein